jgi:serine/threonine protein kinase
MHGSLTRFRYVFLTLYPRSASEHPTPWPHGRLIRFFRALLQTIHALHQLDISHEDLKRSNVLVDEEGWPVVVDFGFSHFKPGGGLVKTSGGTLDYSSPEKVEVNSAFL